MSGAPAVGIDLVEVGRLARSLERTPTLRTRLFTTTELALASTAAAPDEFLAGRFAAKEAVMKLLRCGVATVGFDEIEVTRDHDGAPVTVLSGRAAGRAEHLRLGPIAVSISHDGGLATAIAMAIGAPAERHAPVDPAQANRGPTRDTEVGGDASR